MGWVSITAFLAAVLAGCNYHESKTVLLEGQPETFQTITRDLFGPYCLRCHQGPDAAMGLDLSNYNECVHDGWLVPGDPEGSVILGVIEEGTMPPSGAQPGPALRERLREWIQLGAAQ